MAINTTANIAARLGVSQRTVQRAVKALGLTPAERVGQAAVLSDRDAARVKRAIENTVIGRPPTKAKRKAAEPVVEQVSVPPPSPPPAAPTPLPAPLPPANKTKTGTLIR